MKTMALPEWAYDALARQIAATEVDWVDCCLRGKPATFTAQLLWNDMQGREYELDMEGELAVREEDMSFDHEFGCEHLYEALPTGIDEITGVELFDEDGEDCRLLMDEDLLMKKVEMLCW